MKDHYENEKDMISDLQSKGYLCQYQVDGTSYKFTKWYNDMLGSDNQHIIVRHDKFNNEFAVYTYYGKVL